MWLWGEGVIGHFGGARSKKGQQQVKVHGNLGFRELNKDGIT